LLHCIRNYEISLPIRIHLLETEMTKRTLWVVLLVVLSGFLSGPVSAADGPLGDARTLFAERHYDQAIALVKEEIKKSGESADLLVVMADSHLALEKKRKARKLYRRALELDPGHTDGNLNFAMLLVADRDRERAITLIQRVLTEHPDHARAHFCLGMAYNAKADINDAFAQYKILKKLDEPLAAELYDAIFLK